MTLPLDQQPVSWEVIEGAIYDWVVALTGCEAIYSDQNVPQPAYPYMDLKRSSVIRLGGPPEQRFSTDLTRPNGQEIELLTTSPVEFTLTVQAHIDEESGANKPDLNAVKLLSKLQASLGQQSVRDDLSDAGLSIVEELQIVDLSISENGRWINRAAMDVRLRTASVITDRTGFIEKVEVESTELGIGPEVFDASL